MLTDGSDAVFQDFQQSTLSLTTGVTLRLRHGGSGPPLLLLHGNPQTHAMWHRVAPALAQRFTVICPDLRGYGFSSKPPPSADHAAYAKRAMAEDMVALMRQLGHPRFMIGAHDRGARVAHRLCLDHPEAVERVALLDIIPTIEHFERTDMAFAMGYYHWFFLAQPHPVPERMIRADARAWLLGHSGKHGVPPDFFSAEALADYLAALAEPGTIEAICEDYRAAATIDLVHDRESRAAGQRITAPLAVLWGAKGKVGAWYDVPAIWRGYADDLRLAEAVPSGHYLAEEAPEAVLDAFGRFFSA
jgi:haloacetate dehalogenase